MAESVTIGDKLLLKLRVPELRFELAKRGCSKSGVKALLVERLQEAIWREKFERDRGEWCERGNDSSTEEEARTRGTLRYRHGSNLPCVLQTPFNQLFAIRPSTPTLTCLPQRGHPPPTRPQPERRVRVSSSSPS